MKLRIILIILSLLSFLSASTTGYFYYSSSRKSAFHEADRQSALHADTLRDHLASRINEYLKSVRVLAGLEQLRYALSVTDPTSLQEVHAILDHFQCSLHVDVCYLMDIRGHTIASSNRNAPDSFLGKNYAFRPYFREAIQGQPAVYMALGITSKRRGVYYSHPVYGATPEKPIGVAVIKASIEPLKQDFHQDYEGIVALVDPNGIIFISNRKDWLYHFLWKPSPEDINRVAETRQFGQGPWNWTGLELKDQTHALDLSGNEYVFYRTEIDNYPGWSIVYLHDFQAIANRISASLIKITGIVILSLCAVIGLFVFFLYRKASYHITQRRVAEEALKESEETTLALLNAPTEGAFLLDTEGTILALNKPAAKRFGKSLHELIGICAFDLFPIEVTASRKSHHEWVVRTGKPFLYEDKIDGRWLNTNLYPVFDGRGQVVRVAVFSRDVTEQKEAEEALRIAKEKLSQYSKELERRVKKRSREITSILKYTPNVVFIKDIQRRYILINSRFEELFGIRNEAIQGKTDEEILPREIAVQSKRIETEVLEKGICTQREEKIPHHDGIHEYLSIKFPLYDEEGSVSGICGISTDITVLKKAQDQLRRLSGSIMAGQEKERTAIARELHDELGQMLTALRIDAVWIRERIKKSDIKAADRTQAMCDLIDKTIDEVRVMAVRLRPGVLDDLGLIPALEWYTSDFEKRTGIPCSFRHHRVPPLDNPLSTAAYRIAQEALTNVARHALASRVDVILQRQNGLLNLSIADNGRGFDPKDLSDSECLGIAGMHERAGLVGGSLDIQFSPETGTIVFFRVPIPGTEEIIH